jgi:hypothetical protein
MAVQPNRGRSGTRAPAQSRRPTPAAAPAPAGTAADAVLTLQQHAGNRAVSRALESGGTAVAVTWNVPAEVSVTGRPIACHTGADVAAALSYLAAVLRDEGSALDEDAEHALRAMAGKVDAEATRYAGAGPLTDRDPGYLTGYVQLAESLARAQVDAAVSRCLAQLVRPDGDQQQLESIMDDLAEQAHQAFIGTSQEQLESAFAAMAKVTSINGKIKSYSGKLTKVTDLLGDLKATAKLGEIAKKVNELSKAVGEQVGRAKDVFEAARDLATLKGIAGTSNGTAMMQGINQFAAGIDLVDKTIGRFGKAVPLFGELWSQWYQPMINSCIKGLRIIAKYEEREGREFEIVDMMSSESDGSLRRDANGAPILSHVALAGGYFPGGQAVFSFVYAIRHGQAPAMSGAVRAYFLDRTDLFNVHEEEKLAESEWKLLHPSTWSRSGRSDNVSDWVSGHADKVWSLLYGDLGRYIP